MYTRIEQINEWEMFNVGKGVTVSDKLRSSVTDLQRNS